MKIAIIGGTGKFGQHLGEYLEEDHDIVISGSDFEEAEEIAQEKGWSYGENKDIVSNADIVIVSVPIGVTVDVINEIGSEVPDDALLCDITSVKKKPCDAMEKYSNEVLGMHPMYAPSNSIQGQKVILCPIKGEKWEVMKEFWEDNGATTHIVTTEEHDKAMSLVQGLMHFSQLVVAETIRRSSMSGEDMNKFSSPVYRLVTDLTARILNQKPRLYGAIQKENPENEIVRANFIESADKIRDILVHKPDEDFEQLFDQLSEQFDLEGAQERTDSIIEFLTNEVK